MKLIRQIERETESLLVGYAFNDKPAEIYPKAYLRTLYKNLSAMRAELIERLHGTIPFYTGPNTYELNRECIIKGIYDTIQAIKEVIVNESKELIIQDIVLKSDTPYGSDLILQATLPEDESQTPFIVKKAVLRDVQYQIIREFIFHVYLATHKQLARCEYRIVKLIGICKKDDVIYLITEYAEFGNLLGMTLRPENKIRNRERVILSDEWFYLLNDIIIGMRHLHSSHVLHRNLDSTNVLVRYHPETNTYQALVSDLSSAAFYNEDLKYVYPPIGCKYGNISNSYETICGTTLNYHISSPEVLHAFKFSPASESYAFGILLWRLLFDGRMPYAQAEDFEWFIDLINSGIHLEIDEEWDDDLKNAMKLFLSFNPEERPLLSMNSTLLLFSNLEKSITDLSYGLKQLRDRVDTPRVEITSSSTESMSNADVSLRCILQ